MRGVRWPTFAIVFCACWMACALPDLLAERSKLGLSPEDQKHYDELIRSAERNKSAGLLAIRVGAGFLAIGLLWCAYSTASKGLKITTEKTLKGPAATTLAVILALLGIGLAIGGVLYLPSLVL